MTMESDSSNMGGVLNMVKSSHGKVVPGGSLTPHKLLGMTGYLSGTTVFCQAQPGHIHSDEAAQCHSSHIYQQTRKNTLPSTLPIGSNNMEMVHSKKYLPTAPAR